MKIENKILYIIFFFISCSVNTGSISLEDEVFLETIYGEYSLTTEGASYFNLPNNFFIATPNPPFSINDGFVIPSTGTININNRDNTSHIILAFKNTISTKVDEAVFQILYPKEEESGDKTKFARFLKITFDSQTNLIISDECADTINDVENLAATILFASPF